ncbi:MAG TPA: hypothetical protein VGJ45_17830 [Pseudonocardiaceae bacterium]|jgi:hypothetical protein
MSTITIEVPVELPAEQVQAELTNAGGLGPFLSEPIRSESDCRVSVADREPGTCTVSAELETDRADDDLVRTELQRAVAALAQRALTDASPDETGRAWH